MNIKFLSYIVVKAADHLEGPIHYPWPLGTFAHVSFLACFIFGAPRHALMLPFIPASVAYRQRCLNRYFNDCASNYRECTGHIIVALVCLLRDWGLQLSEIKSFLLYAFILLLRFRQSKVGSQL